jgi:hypothetical protein
LAAGLNIAVEPESLRVVGEFLGMLLGRDVAQYLKDVTVAWVLLPKLVPEDGKGV